MCVCGADLHIKWRQTDEQASESGFSFWCIFVVVVVLGLVCVGGGGGGGGFSLCVCSKLGHLCIVS